MRRRHLVAGHAGAPSPPTLSPAVAADRGRCPTDSGIRVSRPGPPGLPSPPGPLSRRGGRGGETASGGAKPSPDPPIAVARPLPDGDLPLSGRRGRGAGGVIPIVRTNALFTRGETAAPPRRPARRWARVTHESRPRPLQRTSPLWGASPRDWYEDGPGEPGHKVWERKPPLVSRRLTRGRWDAAARRRLGGLGEGLVLPRFICSPSPAVA